MFYILAIINFFILLLFIEPSTLIASIEGGMEEEEEEEGGLTAEELVQQYMERVRSTSSIIEGLGAIRAQVQNFIFSL